jgi:branched-chain amino acid transport system ATP-binding protein
VAPVLEALDLHKSFGAVVAAAEVNLSIDALERVGIIGANGAGKTTFINIVTGYVTPTTGRILFRGREIGGRPPRAIVRLGMARSFQMPQLFDELSVRDNLLMALGVAPRGRSFWQPLERGDTVSGAERILARYGIADYATQSAGLLPQGVRKLLDIAMAMAAEPSLVLLDEPTSGISVDEKFALMDTLMEALRGQGVTVLFVEHDMEIVERYAERVVAFYGGRIIADDAPGRVFADPKVREYVIGTPLAGAAADGTA